LLIIGKVVTTLLAKAKSYYIVQYLEL